MSLADAALRLPAVGYRVLLVRTLAPRGAVAAHLGTSAKGHPAEGRPGAGRRGRARWGPVSSWFGRGRLEGLWQRILVNLRRATRQKEGRNPAASDAIVDSQ